MKYAFYAALAGVSLSVASSLTQADLLGPVRSAPAQAIAHLDVFKDPQCGCCQSWINHVTQTQFATTVYHPNDLSAVKKKYGIGLRYRSCHTGVSKDGYVFEGHIPGKLIHEFLVNPPEGAVGLSVPGMPVGSPGMEYQNKFQPYPVLLLKADGSAEKYAMISRPEEQY